MSGRQSSETLLAAKAVLEKDANIKDAILTYRVGRTTVYRLVSKYSPYNAKNKQKLKLALDKLRCAVP
jgi:transposase